MHMLLSIAFVLALSTFSTFISAWGQEGPRRGGTLVIGLNGDPAHFNSAISFSMQVNQPAQSIGQPLITRVFDEKTGKVINVGVLAESWKFSSDGKTLIFNLIKAPVKWHDGKTFSSADVKFTMEEVWKKYHPAASTFMNAVDSIETPDQYTVVVRLKSPFPDFVELMTSSMHIVAKHLYENTDILKNPNNMKPIGTGAFKFVEYVKGDHVTVVRNDEFYIPGQPYLDKVIYKIITDPATQVLALEKKEIDYIREIAATEVPRLQQLGFQFSLKGEGSRGQGLVRWVAINPDGLKLSDGRMPLADVKVRRALAHAVDKEAIVKYAYVGFGKPNHGILPTYTDDYQDEAVVKYLYDVEKANKLLDEAGYPKGADGIRFSLGLINNKGRADQVKSAEVLVEMFKKIGIDTKWSSLEDAIWREKTYKTYDYHLSILGIGTTLLSDTQRLFDSRRIKATGEVANPNMYKNSEVDALYDQFGYEPDPAKRKDLGAKIQKTISTDCPLIPLVETFGIHAWNPDFVGLPVGEVGNTDGLQEVWWKKGASITTAKTTTATTATTTVPTAAAPDFTTLATVVAVVIIAGVAGLYYMRGKRSRSK